MTPRAAPIAIALYLMLQGCVGAADNSRSKDPPWQLPRFDGSDAAEIDRTKPPAGSLDPGPAINHRQLYDLVVDCYPTKTWWAPEISLEGRLTQSERRHDLAAQAAETASYIGVVARVPLYSQIEIDRERERERLRRREIADAVGKLVALVAEREVHQRELDLMRAIEDRSARRVAIGVAETTEQITAIRNVAQLESKIIQNRADMQAQSLVIIGMCKDRSDVEQVVTSLLDKGWSGQ